MDYLNAEKSTFGKAVYHSKVSGHFHVHVRKQRLLAGAKKDWCRSWNSGIARHESHYEQHEPLNLSLDKNRKPTSPSDKIIHNLVNNHSDDDETPLTIDENFHETTCAIELQNPPNSHKTNPYKHFKKRKLLQRQIEETPALEPPSEELITTTSPKSPPTLPIAKDQTLRRPRKIISCDKCEYETTRKSDFQQHMKEHTPKKSNSRECKSCGHHLKRKNAEQRTEAAGLLPPVCRKCEATERLLLKKKRRVVDVTHQCGNCEFKTTEIEAFEEHLRRHADEEPFRCSICLFQTPWKTEFNFHMDKHYSFKIQNDAGW